MATERSRKQHSAEQHEERGQPDRFRTGVGTPDEHAEAGGMALGGDTGDVGTPRDQLDGTPGGTFGTASTPEGVTAQRPPEPEEIRAAQRERKQRSA